MDKITEKYTAKAKTEFDQWYASDEGVADIITGILMLLRSLEAPQETKELCIKGFNLLAKEAFNAGGRFGSSMALKILKELQSS